MHMNNALYTLNNVLSSKQANECEDDCELYCRLLARKLKQYTITDRQELMYEIDGLLIKKNRMSTTRHYVSSPSQIIISNNRPLSFHNYSRTNSTPSPAPFHNRDTHQRLSPDDCSVGILPQDFTPYQIPSTHVTPLETQQTSDTYVHIKQEPYCRSQYNSNEILHQA